MSSSMDYTRMVFVTGNVEFLIEEPARLTAWSEAVAKEVCEQKPMFAAVHLQGLGKQGRTNEFLERLTKGFVRPMRTLVSTISLPGWNASLQTEHSTLAQCKVQDVDLGDVVLVFATR
ncbi:unnamed protein product [Soboliphyme baturini]|uniref:STAS domain-containing protein n=1 Tax=Soboliphyme baturini TaxID=241478 RepID=A0A183IDW8_9BILA|nr:unnamed protein product [Soboliphyme baturini]